MGQHILSENSIGTNWNTSKLLGHGWDMFGTCSGYHNSIYYIYPRRSAAAAAAAPAAGPHPLPVRRRCRNLHRLQPHRRVLGCIAPSLGLRHERLGQIALLLSQHRRCAAEQRQHEGSQALRRRRRPRPFGRRRQEGRGCGHGAFSRDAVAYPPTTYPPTYLFNINWKYSCTSYSTFDVNVSESRQL